jgi:hypothetical protein
MSLIAINLINNCRKQRIRPHTNCSFNQHTNQTWRCANSMACVKLRTEQNCGEEELLIWETADNSSSGENFIVY